MTASDGAGPAQGEMQTTTVPITIEMLYTRLGQKDMEIALLHQQLAQAQQLLVQAQARLTHLGEAERIASEDSTEEDADDVRSGG